MMKFLKLCWLPFLLIALFLCGCSQSNEDEVRKAKRFEALKGLPLDTVLTRAYKFYEPVGILRTFSSSRITAILPIFRLCSRGAFLTRIRNLTLPLLWAYSTKILKKRGGGLIRTRAIRCCSTGDTLVIRT